jgi:tripartite-type tricarboxylate transporter receptor subunit TctC
MNKTRSQWRQARAKGVTLAAIAMFGFYAPTVRSQAFPTRPIQIVVAFTPGGPNDLVGRMLAAQFSERWGVSAIVDNRPGANGMVGGNYVARAKPDGYTLMIAASSVMTINANLMPDTAFNPVKDFAPISNLVTGIFMLVVHPAVPVHSVGELIAYAKNHSRKLTFGSGGVGSGAQLSGVLFGAMAGVDMTHIAYKGGAPALADLLGGHIDMIFSDISAATPLVRSDKLRALAVTGSTRSPAFPDLPTIAQAGVRGYEVVSWYGLVAPAGTPAALISILNQETQRFVNTPDFRARVELLGLEPASDTPQAFQALIERDAAKWAEVIKTYNVHAE